MYACSRLASGSSPARFHSSQNPDLENGVQGGPPTSRSGRWPGPQTSLLAKSRVWGRQRMSLRMTGEARW